MPSPIIYYIRHGETPWNAEGRFQGSIDIPLNDKGCTQATAAGRILGELIARNAREPHHFGYVSSPLSRARMTMDLLRGSLGLPVEGYSVEHRLREIGWGEWEGKTVPEMQAHDPATFAARRKDKWNVTAPKGETYAEVTTRVRAWLDGLEGDTVAVAHGGTLRALMVAAGVASADEAIEARAEQGVVYVFANGAVADTVKYAAHLDLTPQAARVTTAASRAARAGLARFAQSRSRRRACPVRAKHIKPMSFNTFGHMFRVTTFGESHGVAIGCVVDGCPPQLPLTAEEIQRDLDRRRPGQSRFTTQRQEPDEVKILSGVMEHPDTGVQVTTGTPIALLIENTDQRSKDYSDIKDKFRPGHADFTYDTKYGLRDYRGGGRSSARETAMRVAAGAIARKVVPGMTVRGALVQMGPHKIDRERWDWNEVGSNPFFCPDKTTAEFWEGYLDGVRKAGSSIGAVIEIVAEGVPAGLGAPIYGKLDGDLASALMSINAVKGVEIGAGFGAAEKSGEDNADEMRMGNQGPVFMSNNAGGILGGISTGQPVVARFAVKPTSSILTPRKTIDRNGADTEIMTKGRHDPCVGIRAVPVGEAMVACVLADHFLRHRGQVGS